MIYWHVEKGRLCVHSQLKSCSSSEVGFAFTHLLGYSLLPRLKNIGAARLYLPDASQAASLPHLTHVVTRPIRWELIAEQYDQMVKFATALKLRTTEAEQILRRFTRPGPQHPTYAALVELAPSACFRKAPWTPFLRKPTASPEVCSTP